LVAIWDRGRLGVWDTASGRRLVELASSRNGTWCIMTYHLPSGESRVGMGSGDGYVVRYNGETFEAMPDIPAFRSSPTTCLVMCLDPEVGQPRLVAASGSGAVSVLDDATGEVLHELPPLHQGVSALTAFYSSEGRARVVAGSREGELRVYDVNTGETLHDLPGNAAFVRALACFPSSFAPYGPQVVSATNLPPAQLWDAEGGTLARALPGHERCVYTAVAYQEHAGGRDRIATGGDDKGIRVYDAETGALVSTLYDTESEIHRLVAFEVEGSPPEWRLASRSQNGRVMIWDPEGGRHVQTLAQGGRGLGIAQVWPIAAVYVAPCPLLCISIGHRPEGRACSCGRIGHMADHLPSLPLRGLGREGSYLTPHMVQVPLSVYQTEASRVCLATRDFPGGTLRIWDVGQAPDRSAAGLRAANKSG
jgi:hypothetical protein